MSEDRGQANRIIGNTTPPSKIDRSLVDKLNAEAREAEKRIRTTQADASGVILDKGDYLRLRNIDCVGSDGEVFEHYDAIDVPKWSSVPKREVLNDYEMSDVPKSPSAPKQRRNGGDGQNDMGNGHVCFVPSMALYANILAALYAERERPEIKEILDQHQDKRGGLDLGLHSTNTIIDNYARILHYPRRERTGQPGSDAEAIRPFSYQIYAVGIQEMIWSLDMALRSTTKRAFVQDLTGLREPDILVEIGRYFNQEARLFLPREREENTTWIGCNSYNDFAIGASGDPGGRYRLRAVRPQGNCGAGDKRLWHVKSLAPEGDR